MVQLGFGAALGYGVSEDLWVSSALTSLSLSNPTYSSNSESAHRLVIYSPLCPYLIPKRKCSIVRVFAAICVCDYVGGTSAPTDHSERRRESYMRHGAGDVSFMLWLWSAAQASLDGRERRGACLNHNRRVCVSVCLLFFPGQIELFSRYQS